MYVDIKKANKLCFKTIIAAAAFLLVGYVFQVFIKQIRPVSDFLIIAALTIVPISISFYYLKKFPETTQMRMAGFLGFYLPVTYSLVMMHNFLMFAACFPVILMFTFYNDYKFIRLISFMCGASVLASIIMFSIFSEGFFENTTDILIAIATISIFIVVLPIQVKKSIADSEFFISEQHKKTIEIEKMLEKEKESAEEMQTLLEENERNIAYQLESKKQLEEAAEADQKNKKSLEQLIKKNNEIIKEQEVKAIEAKEMLERTEKLKRELSLLIEEIAKSSSEVNLQAKHMNEQVGVLLSIIDEEKKGISNFFNMLHQFSKQVEENVEAAKNATALSINAKTSVQGGNEQMRKVLKSMQTISEKSKEIEKIVATIDSISFQTGILSLNASIEAARAGKYGAGFTVVAEEVRNLSNQSVQAVKDTTVLMESALSAIEDGSVEIDKTDIIFKNINTSTEQLIELFDKVAASAMAQTEKIGYLESEINVIMNILEKTAQAVTVNSDISDKLLAEADRLAELVNR